MIWTITLNAVIDHVYLLSGDGSDSATLAEASWHVPAGKGVNVSRAIHSLGGTSAAIVVSDGAHRVQYCDALESAAATPHIVVARPAVRHHATIVHADGRHLHARERGAPCAEHCLAAIVRVLEAVEAGDHVAMSGSLPPGMAADSYARLVRVVRDRGGRAWVDCSGVELSQAVAAGPFAVKVNAREASVLAGREIGHIEEAAAAVRALVAGGVECACVTLGAAGLVAGDLSGTVHAGSEARSTGSSIGSGDAALAALLVATSRGAGLVDSARLAAAAGTANTGGQVPGSFSPSQLDTALGAAWLRWLA